MASAAFLKHMPGEDENEANIAIAAAVKRASSMEGGGEGKSATDDDNTTRSTSQAEAASSLLSPPKGSFKFGSKNVNARHSASVVPHGPWCHGKPAHEVVRDKMSEGGKVLETGTACNVRCAGCRAVRRLAYHHFMYESGEIQHSSDDKEFITFEDMSQIYGTCVHTILCVSLQVSLQSYHGTQYSHTYYLFVYNCFVGIVRSY